MSPLNGLVDSGELDAAVMARPRFAPPPERVWRPLRSGPFVVAVPHRMHGTDRRALLGPARAILGAVRKPSTHQASSVSSHRAHPLPQLSIDAAIVDLDGTLVDTLGDFEAALARMLAEHGRPPIGRAVLSQMVGKGSEHLVQLALAHAGLPAADAPDALPRYLHHYADVNGLHSALFPGVREGLEALRARGVPLLCLTNKPATFARNLLETLDLARYFGTVFGGDSFARKKPDPLPVLESCRALGTAPARTLMLGDSSNDAQAARAAGCPVVLVTYGYNHGQPVRQVDADGFVDALSEVPALLATPA